MSLENVGFYFPFLKIIFQTIRFYFQICSICVDLRVYFLYFRNECFEQISGVQVSDPGQEGRRFNPAGMWLSGV